MKTLKKISLYLLSLLTLISIFCSCEVKLQELKIKTEQENIKVYAHLTNEYKNKFLSGNAIHKKEINAFKEMCLRYDIHEKIHINSDTTKVIVEIEINGIDKINTIAQETCPMFYNSFDMRLFKVKENAVVWIYFNPTIFNDGGSINIENSKTISDFKPINNNNNFEIIEKNDDNITIKVHTDKTLSLNKPQEITYNYSLYEIKEQQNKTKTFNWGYKDPETWLFIFGALGAIVSFVTIKNYKYRRR